MRIGIYLIFLMMTSIGMVACSKKDAPSYDWEWDDDKDDTPGKDKSRILWIDAAANFPDFANSKENIRRDLKLAVDAGFTAIVVDVRPTTGDVLFRTDVVNQVEWLGAWLPSGYSKIVRSADWDYLQAFIDEAAPLDLEVYANINTFVGGNNTAVGSAGVLYRDSEKQEWATKLLTTDGVVSTMEVSGTGARFLNPVRTDVQDYICDMLKDLAAYDGLKGILLDRGRFNNLYSDFSDYSREKFEEYLGYSVNNFPQSVMSPDIKAGSLPGELPEYFKEWLEFRVKIMRDFMAKARTSVKGVNPEVDFGVYVGGWYSTYYEVGVNWASPEYDTNKKYSKWATPQYRDYGYADLMDVILIGAYAAPDRIYGSSEWTVQGFCAQAMDLIGDDAVVVGGTDVGNGAWATSSASKVNEGIVNSVDVILDVSDGYFLFDMIHLKQKPEKWAAVKKGINEAIK